MKKVLAVILITVMIAALVPITSVAQGEPAPDTYFYNTESQFNYAIAYFIWPDMGLPGEMFVEFITPNDFGGCKFYCQSAVNNDDSVSPLVGIELYDENLAFIESVDANPADTQLTSVSFSTAYPAGKYFLKFTLKTAGGYFALRAAESSGVGYCRVYVDVLNNSRYSFPAPALILTGATYTGARPAKDADTPLTAGRFTSYHYWAGNGGGLVANAINTNEKADGWHLNVKFQTPRAFKNIVLMTCQSANIVAELFDANGVKVDEGSAIAQDAGNNAYANTEIAFAAAHAPGEYVLKFTFSSNTSTYFVVAGDTASYETGVTIETVKDGTDVYYISDAANEFPTVPRILLKGAENPNPGAFKVDPDTWLCDISDPYDWYGTTYSNYPGWWPAAAGGGHSLAVIFNTPNSFCGFSAYFWGNGTVNVELRGENGNLLESGITYRNYANQMYPVNFSKTYDPGKYTIIFSYDSDEMILGTAGASDVPVSVACMSNTAINEFTRFAPFIKLRGGISNENIKTDTDQLLFEMWGADIYNVTDPEKAIVPVTGWQMVGANQNQATPRYIAVNFTSDIWFSGIRMVTFGSGIVKITLMKYGTNEVVESQYYQALTDAVDVDKGHGLMLFSKEHAPGKYVLKFEDEGYASEANNAYYFMLGAWLKNDSRVSVDYNISPAGCAFEGENYSIFAPAIRLFGSVNHDRFTSINATLTDGNLVNLNFKADAKILADSDNAAEDYVTFAYGEESKNVTGVDNGNGQYVFNLPGLTVEELDKPITATLHRKVGGTEKTAELISGYTGKAYFETLINDPAQGTNVKALAAATLDYGAAAQAYASETPTMTPADPTAYATAIAARKATLTSVKALDGTGVVNKKASWTAVGLKLEDEVSIRYKFKLLDASAASTAKIYFSYGSTVKTVDLSDLTSIGNNVYVYYLPMPANLLSETVTAVIKEGDEAISSTFTYSVESYAYAKKDDADTTLADLVTAMMIYGDAAATYVANPDD